MNLSDQKLNEILKHIIDTYGSKGSITTNTLCDIMEKYETTPAQMDFVYKSIAEAGIRLSTRQSATKSFTSKPFPI